VIAALQLRLRNQLQRAVVDKIARDALAQATAQKAPPTSPAPKSGT
jgi:hypothetical protein